MVKTYISLTKPGIIWGNLIAATGGFMLAAQGNPDIFLYLVTMLGIALVIASGCVFNNVIDADIDAHMERTNDRAMVIGSVPVNSALGFALLLSALGFYLIAHFTNPITLAVSAFGFFAYVVLYTLMYKRSSVHGTVVGSLSGASPPTMGYLSVTGQFDVATALIFLGFCAWQMPHSYAIGIFRDNDFRQSRIPLLPIVKGLNVCRQYMLVYVVVFWLMILAMFAYKYIGIISLLVMSCISGYWLYQIHALYQPETTDFIAATWGKKMFITSIFAITLFSIVISIDYIPR